MCFAYGIRENGILSMHAEATEFIVLLMLMHMSNDLNPTIRELLRPLRRAQHR